MTVIMHQSCEFKNFPYDNYAGTTVWPHNFGMGWGGYGLHENQLHLDIITDDLVTHIWIVPEFFTYLLMFYENRGTVKIQEKIKEVLVC